MPGIDSMIDACGCTTEDSSDLLVEVFDLAIEIEKLGCRPLGQSRGRRFGGNRDVLLAGRRHRSCGDPLDPVRPRLVLGEKRCHTIDSGFSDLGGGAQPRHQNQR